MTCTDSVTLLNINFSHVDNADMELSYVEGEPSY